MTMLSVIVAVRNVQGYLQECLESVLDTEHADLELIAVDDASTDHSAQMLAEAARLDARLRIIRSDQQLGPGRARDLGLRTARGDFVWFVDADDLLAPGTVNQVLRHLAEDDPNVLLVDVGLVGFDGRIQRDWRRSPHRPGNRVAGLPRVTLPPPPIGAYVLRRALMREHRLTFGAGWYEEIPFGVRALTATDRVVSLERVCYVQRTGRQEAIRAHPDPRHREAIDRYDEQLALLRARGDVGVLARAYSSALAQLLNLLGDPRRIEPGRRRDFFAELSGFARRNRPTPDWRPGGRLARLRHRLVLGGRYRTFELLRSVRHSASRLKQEAQWLRRAAGRWKGRLRRRALRLYYQVQLRRPIDESLAVYAAYWYRGYACNPAAIYERAAELAPHIRGVWVVWGDRLQSLPDGVAHVEPHTRAYYRTLARARWLVNNVGFPEHVVKRPGTTQVQTHHGTPLKVMGLDQQRFPVTARGMDFDDVLRSCGQWDFSVTSNPHTTEVWERAFPFSGEVLEVGYPRNDQLATATPQDVARARRELGLAPDEVALLYAPTHRDHHAGFKPVLDVEDFADRLGAGHRVLVRAHYFYDTPAMPKHPLIKDVSRHPSIETLCLASDLLVTDYSSLMFDYAVLDRPIIIFAPDWETYRTVRGVTFDLLSNAPGSVCATPADLVEAIRSGEAWGDQAAKARDLFRQRFCGLDDGHAAERVVRRVFLGDTAGGSDSGRTGERGGADL
jgi:CDP-glycerol glycerophosphotransferase